MLIVVDVALCQHFLSRPVGPAVLEHPHFGLAHANDATHDLGLVKRPHQLHSLVHGLDVQREILLVKRSTSLEPLGDTLLAVQAPAFVPTRRHVPKRALGKRLLQVVVVKGREVCILVVTACVQRCPRRRRVRVGNTPRADGRAAVLDPLLRAVVIQQPEVAAALARPPPAGNPHCVRSWGSRLGRGLGEADKPGALSATSEGSGGARRRAGIRLTVQAGEHDARDDRSGRRQRRQRRVSPPTLPQLL